MESSEQTSLSELKGAQDSVQNRVSKPEELQREKVDSTLHQPAVSTSHTLPPHLVAPSFHPASLLPGFQPKQYLSMNLPRPYFPFANQPGSGMIPSRTQNRVDEAWTAHRSGDSVYYYNSMTGISQWDRPLRFQGDALTTTEKPKPISTDRVSGTDWLEVKCEDNRVYYFNTKSRETAWSVPLEVSRAKLPILPPPPSKTPGSVPFPQPKVETAQSVEVKTVRKATKQEIENFRELLREVGVNAYSRYGKEAVKLEKDPRWHGVSLQREKKQLFEEFCQEAAQTERDSKQKAQQKFKHLLREIQQLSKEDGEVNDSLLLSKDITFELLEEKYQSDSRWKACSVSMRKELYQRYRESRPKLWNTDKNKAKQRLGEKSRRQEQLVHETKESQLRLKRALHTSAVSNYKTLLIEAVKQPNASWYSIREKLESDIQGRGKDPSLKDEERERLFYDHLEEMKEVASREYRKLLKEKLPSLKPPEEEMDPRDLEAFQSRFQRFEEAEKLLIMDVRSIQPTRETKRRLWRAHVVELGGDLGEDRRKKPRH